MKIMANNSHSQQSTTRPVRNGFTVIEAVIVVAIVGIVGALGLLGITKARASMRLAGAAREYAGFIEKVRTFSIRSHADTIAEAASVTINPDLTSYTVTYDFDGDGTMESRTIQLPDGVEFNSEETIAFDWRGRTWNVVGGLTREDAQVSITLTNGTDSASVDVTGAGDVTVDSRVFDDEVPNVSLNVPHLDGATPEPSPTATIEAETSGSPSPTPADSDATPTPTPRTALEVTPSPTPIQEESPLPDPSPTETATPTPTPTRTATPTPTPIVPCVITAVTASATIGQDGITTIVVSHNSSSSLTITATSSKSSELQATPNTLTVAPYSTAIFTVKSKKSSGSYTVTLSASCGEVVVGITVS